MAAGEEGGAFPAAKRVVSGTIKNFDKSEEPVYVRLTGLYLDYVIEDRLDVSGNSGTFTLAGDTPEGEFLLITIGRTRVLDTREIKIPQNNPLVIDLAER